MAVVVESSSAVSATNLDAFMNNYKEDLVTCISCTPVANNMPMAQSFWMDGVWSWHNDVLNARFEYRQIEGDTIHFNIVGTFRDEMSRQHVGLVQRWSGPPLPKGIATVVIHGANGQEVSFPIKFVE